MEAEAGSLQRTRRGVGSRRGAECGPSSGLCCPWSLHSRCRSEWKGRGHLGPRLHYLPTSWSSCTSAEDAVVALQSQPHTESNLGGGGGGSELSGADLGAPCCLPCLPHLHPGLKAPAPQTQLWGRQ